MWGTPGILSCGDELWIATLERKWDDNKPETSCIPTGKYRARLGDFPKHGKCFEVTNVPNRTTILFHKGNFQTDSLGCILLGTGFGVINDGLAISMSGVAFDWFNKFLAGETEFELEIR